MEKKIYSPQKKTRFKTLIGRYGPQIEIFKTALTTNTIALYFHENDDYFSEVSIMRRRFNKCKHKNFPTLRPILIVVDRRKNIGNALYLPEQILYHPIVSIPYLQNRSKKSKIIISKKINCVHKQISPKLLIFAKFSFF